MPQGCLSLVLLVEIVEADFVELDVEFPVLLAVVRVVHDPLQRKRVCFVGSAGLELVLNIEFELSVFCERQSPGV